jgi:hypothetical protein
MNAKENSINHFASIDTKHIYEFLLNNLYKY